MPDLEKEKIIENAKNFTPYGTDSKKDKMVKSNYWRSRLKIAEEGYGLNILINDEHWYVREAVADQGYGLDILVNDEHWGVRAAVADQGYGLDVLINDKDYDVRIAVVNQGYGLDILIADKNLYVREAVLYYLKENNLTLAEWCNQNNKEIDLIKLAFSPYPEARITAIESGYVYKDDEIYIDSNYKFIPYGTDSKKDKMINNSYYRERLKMAKEGYGLNILINDEEWEVRAAVAKRGYGLDILITDKNLYVRKAVLYYLKENNLTLAEWCNQNNKGIDLIKLAFSSYPEVRAEAVKSGYVYKENEIYITPDCKFTSYSTDPGKDKMIKSDDWGNRLEMAEEGYGLDILINDEDYNVREAVAKQGYGLNVLINDEDYGVRIIVAEQGYGLDALINDEHWRVRRAVAEQGYGLDILVNDKDYDVQEAVKNYLTSHNLTLEQWKSNQEHSETDIINQAKNAINDGNIDIKNVADNIKSTENVLNKNINEINKDR